MSVHFVNFLFTANLVAKPDGTIRVTKNARYPCASPDRRIFKQSRGGRGNPGRANRHIFTNKDMRFW